MKTYLNSVQTKVTSLLAAFLFIMAISANSQTVNNDAVQNFTIKQNNSRVILSWSTSADLNLNHFILEKSSNGKDFKEAGLIFTFEKDANKADYLFPDHTQANETSISYRLVMVSPDGKSSYSKIYSFNLDQHS